MLGSNIANYRKKLGITQEQLAQRLDVTNQAVSKWETDQCCPDTLLLPKIADIFGITIDELFGREKAKAAPELPWEDDDALHIVLYAGHMLVGAVNKKNQDCSFNYEGPARDIYCAVNLNCGDVGGNVTAEGYVECGEVGGSVQAGGYVECDAVGGDVNAGQYVECDDVAGQVQARGYVECGSVDGNLNAGSYVECDDVGGSVNAMSYVECGDVGGNVTAAAQVECGNVGGSVRGGEDDTSGFHFSFNPFKK